MLSAARHAEDLGFTHVAVGNGLLDSGFGLDTDSLVARVLVRLAGPPRATSHSAPGTSFGRKGDADLALAERLGGRHRTLPWRFASRLGKLHTRLSTR